MQSNQNTTARDEQQFRQHGNAANANHIGNPAPPRVSSQTRKGRTLRWTERSELAARLVAEGTKSPVEIAAECGVAYRALKNWKCCPEFQARVAEHRAAARRKLLAASYGSKDKRIQVRTQMIDRCLAIIAERAARPEMQSIPGGSSGMITPRVVQLGSKRTALEYLTDARIDQIIRDNLREIAQELGEWHRFEEVVGAFDANDGNAKQITLTISATQMAVAGDRIVDVEADVVLENGSQNGSQSRTKGPG